MNNKIHEWVNTILILLVAVILIFGIGNNSQSVGSPDGYYRMPNSNATFKTLNSLGAFTATTGTFSDDVTLTTSNTATSTLIAGCIQTYATSTASPVRLVLSSLASSSPTFGAGTATGVMFWQYGSCPV